MHRAKGLEWPKVFLPGLADGMFPFVRENGDRTVELEDERRLFYVAMTRAIEEVVFCHPPDPRLEKHLEAGNCVITSYSIHYTKLYDVPCLGVNG